MSRMSIYSNNSTFLVLSFLDDYYFKYYDPSHFRIVEMFSRRLQGKSKCISKLFYRLHDDSGKP